MIDCATVVLDDFCTLVTVLFFGRMVLGMIQAIE